MNGKSLRIIWWIVKEGKKETSTYHAIGLSRLSLRICYIWMRIRSFLVEVWFLGKSRKILLVRSSNVWLIVVRGSITVKRLFFLSPIIIFWPFSFLKSSFLVYEGFTQIYFKHTERKTPVVIMKSKTDDFDASVDVFCAFLF